MRTSVGTEMTLVCNMLENIYNLSRKTPIRGEKIPVTAIRNNFLRCVVLCAGMAGAIMAHAQAVPTPGEVQDQFRQRNAIPPSSTTGLPAAAEPKSTTGVPPGGKKIQVQRFEITGNSAVGTEELHAIVAPYEGQELTLFEIYDVADLLTHYYRTHGYTVASASVPEQKVASGIITLEVIEGRLSALKVEGNKRYRNEFITWQLSDLKTGEALRDAPLEREMLLLNDMPGLSARAVVQPGDEFGTSDVVVKADDRFANGSLRLNNYGRKSIGEWRVEGDAYLNSPLGVGDRLSFSGAYAEGNLLHYGRLGYSIPVTPQGTVVNTYFATYEYQVAKTKLAPQLATLDIDGEGDNFGVNIMHPFWRSRTKNLYLGVGFDRTVTNQQELTFGTQSKSNLSLAVFTALFNYVGPDNSFSTINATFSTNFNRASRDPVTFALENNAQTAKLQLDLSHYRTLYKQLALYLRGGGVLSADPLADTERFRLGGPGSVRSYASSEVAGDTGYFFSAELQHPLPFVPNTLVKGFVDHGRVYHANHNLLQVRDSEAISGAGVGLLTHAYQYFDLDFSLSHTLGPRESSDFERGLRFWFGLSANF